MFICALTAFLSITFVAEGQTGETDAIVITLNKAIELGLQNNHQLKISETRTRIAESRLQQVKDKALPQAGASVQYANLVTLSDWNLYFAGGAKPLFSLPMVYLPAMIGVASVSKEIFGGFAEKAAKQSSELLIKASILDEKKDAEDIKLNIVQSYYNIYKIFRSAQILDENLSLLDEKEREVNNLLKEGVVTSNEVLKIQLEKSNLQLSKVDVKNAKEVALYNLSLLIGAQEKRAIDIDTNISLDMHDILPVEEMINSALNNRLELEVDAFRKQAVMADFRKLRSIYYPHLDVSGMYVYLNTSPNTEFIPPRYTFLQAVDIGLSLKYNISSLYGMKGRIQEAKLNIKQADNATVLQEDQVKSEVFTQYKAYLSSIEKINVSKVALTQATRSYHLSDSKFRNGLLLSSDLIISQNLLLQSQLNVLQAEIDAQLAYHKLQKASGTKL